MWFLLMRHTRKALEANGNPVIMVKPSLRAARFALLSASRSTSHKAMTSFMCTRPMPLGDTTARNHSSTVSHDATPVGHGFADTIHSSSIVTQTQNGWLRFFPKLASESAIIELPECDMRRAATCRDPLAVVEGYRLEIYLRLVSALGMMYMWFHVF